MNRFAYVLLVCIVGVAQNTSTVFLSGYDLVSYFTEGIAKKGKQTISYTYKKNTYYFSTEENKHHFIKQPETYLPEYGGYCAWGAAGTKEYTGFNADKFPVNPETFKLIGGKLYLYYHKGDYNAKEKWNSLDQDSLISNANRYWKTVKDQDHAPM